MMWRFEDIGQVEKLRAVLAGWQGTPYRFGCAVAGRGTDCIGFFVAVLDALGVRSRPEPMPAYQPDWLVHQPGELVRDSIMRQVPTAKSIDLDAPVMDGDIYLYARGKAANHPAIVCDGLAWQADRVAGVMGAAIDTRRLSKLRFRLRLAAEVTP